MGLKIWTPLDPIIQPKNSAKQWKNQSRHESPTGLHAVPHYKKTIHESYYEIQVTGNSRFVKLTV